MKALRNLPSSCLAKFSELISGRSGGKCLVEMDGDQSPRALKKRNLTKKGECQSCWTNKMGVFSAFFPGGDFRRGISGSNTKMWDWKIRKLNCSPNFCENLKYPKGSLNYQIGGDQTMQIYGSFEGCSLILVPCLVWCHTMTPCSACSKTRFAYYFGVTLGEHCLAKKFGAS